ncbi:YjbF family lipoprotein [Phaeobacter gallaeciensis]|uniref:YjbF family lipoprotein n=1 Tax=Phaeobacter gallaeciensis TaxID=60890 RepID=UPI000BBBD094|nr:YjbF family lipoprotein [Phaeobacter gallaeciensis]ATF20236.1 Group 4 capsule polysaccharide formation lipoprotein gfcB [Phaeobacter gallaeciensis]ATF24345.1 Group 4 capsule polysaccharide formation lipoprotein gfcB [Phaeobacter gallaeciensis]
MMIARRLHRFTNTIAALACLSIAACTNDEREILTTEQLTRGLSEQTTARAAMLANTGAEQMQVRFLKTGRGGVMLQETRRAGLVTWLSSDGASLQTDKGLLRASRGFGAGLMAVDLEQSRRRIFAHAEGSAERFHSYLTGNDETETRTYHCDIRDRGNRTLTIAGQEIATRLIAESCINPDQNFLNLYWLRATDNRLIQSRQWTGPYLGTITTRLQVTP